jgi:hypothetical protein
MAQPPKSSEKLRGKPFTPGDPRIQRGKGPAKGAPNAGRPPDWLKKVMAKGRTKAVVQLRQRMTKQELDNDQLLKLVKEWAPEADRVTGAKVTVSPDGTVVLDLGSA